MIQERDNTYDIMKGIGILLVLIGHVGSLLPQWIDSLISSFHMPLFLFIAGHFAIKHDISSTKVISANLNKSLHRLIIPYVATFGMIILCSIVSTWIVVKQNLHPGGFDFTNGADIIKNVLSLILFSSDSWQTRYGLVGAGPMWFLIALFLGKLLYDLIRLSMTKLGNHKDEWILVVCGLLSIVGCYLHKIFPVLPFSISQGLFSLIFIGIGGYLSNKHFPWWGTIICVVCYILSSYYGSLGVLSCSFGLYGIIGVCGAYGGTMLVKLLSQWLLSKNFRGGVSMLLTNALLWCGTNSLLILCMHTFDWKTIFVRIIKNGLHLPLEGLWSVMFHYAIVFLLVYIITKMPKLNKIYEGR